MRPRHGRSARALVDEVGQVERERNSRTDVVRDLHVHQDLIRRSERTEVVEVAGETIRGRNRTAARECVGRTAGAAEFVARVAGYATGRRGACGRVEAVT